ncbi:MAG TPA: 2-amino-4-hydroxy-6-hydroxymethyldihydropteridine diphosphokinase [Candidatus Omnitrophota bacterium]|nr:2-amino-4-hydroxy-6-hydroxymethyldihydropteridine diphosphokinase [Candidatus Omnitrophota bacterium]
MNTAVIGIGSNISPQKNVKKAKNLLAQTFHVLKESAFIQTKPVGYTDQGDFINGSVYIETALPIEKLSQKMKKLEKQLGRSASPIKYGPRTIDLDIVVFNGEVVDHDFYERDFLKNAVLELIPDLRY